MSKSSVYSYSITYYVCSCFFCNKTKRVQRNINNKIYNAAQAVRSLGWSFGSDSRLVCDTCRQFNKSDKYR